MVFRRAIEEVEKAYYQDQAKLIDRIAELENVQAGLLERGIALEQLCRDMYASIKRWWLWIPNAEFSKHSDLMKDLGLLEGRE